VICSALSGIEQALWDIKGKALGVPAYELLGGAVRDKIRIYCGAGGPDFDTCKASGESARDRGFTAVKTGLFEAVRFVESAAFVDAAVERMAGLREGVGKSVDIGIDFHGRVSPAMSIRLAKALEPYYPFFIEEPVLPENVDALVAVARSTSIPIATGERLFTRFDFREVLEKNAAVILQPDLSHAGGIFETRKIAAMAETYFAAIAPHCPLGPIALAACLQVDACTPNFLCQEQVCLGEGYLMQPFENVGGYIPVPTGPGLGIEVDEPAVMEKVYDGVWENPRLWHEDGSLADW
jgi:galactonate dehydratase